MPVLPSQDVNGNRNSANQNGDEESVSASIRAPRTVIAIMASLMVGGGSMYAMQSVGSRNLPEVAQQPSLTAAASYTDAAIVRSNDTQRRELEAASRLQTEAMRNLTQSVNRIEASVNLIAAESAATRVDVAALKARQR